jgi:hypothetical protein
MRNTAAATHDAPIESARSIPAIWIIARRDDLLWFQGSVVAGLGLLIFFLFAPHFDQAGAYNPTVLAVFLWGAFFDGTHVWATYARTYFAPDEGSRAGIPGDWSWGLLAIGPAIALLAAGFGTPRLFAMFLMLGYLWAYWHLVRQHYGFVTLYRKRAGESGLDGTRLDGLILWTGCLYPFLRFSLSDAYRQSGLLQLIPASLIDSARLALNVGFGLAAIILLMIVLSQRVEPLRLGPKHLLLAIVISFHLLVFALLGNLLTILATLTIFHNLQYHRIVWQYERGLGRVPSGGLVPYLAYGIALGLVWYGLRVLGLATVHSGILRNVLIGLGWGVAFHHYLLDGLIWHVRRSKTVSRALEAGTVAR